MLVMLNQLYLTVHYVSPVQICSPCRYRIFGQHETIHLKLTMWSRNVCGQLKEN